MPAPAARPPRRALRAVLAALALTLAVGCGAADNPEIQAGERVLQYVLVPHPDDEYQAWSLIGERPEAYPVFVLLTRGERTARCDGRGFQPEHGERAPEPQPFVEGDRERCAAQRVDAWHAFLDRMAEVDATLDVPGRAVTLTAAPPDDGPAPAHPDRDGAPLDFDLHVGERSARAVFDLGDGHLERHEVVWALDTVRQVRDRLPVTAEGDALGAAFSNPDGLAKCADYPHADHAAVVAALWAVDLDLPGGQYGRVCATDPRASVVEEVPEAVHEAVWAVDPPPVDPHANPDAIRSGVAQETYGWLAFTFTEPRVYRYWEESDHEADTIFSRRQAFFAAHTD